MSVTKTFTFTTSWRSAPAARRIVRMFSSVCRVSALAPPATSSNEPGLVPSVPATKMKPPAFVACENARSLPSSCTFTFWMSAMEGDGTIGAMKLAGVHHVSLNVDDAEKTGRFYIEVLGLEVLPRPNFPFKGYWLRTGAQEIHLIEVKDHRVPGGEHFAFAVEDIDATCRELEQHGVKVSK